MRFALLFSILLLAGCAIPRETVQPAMDCRRHDRRT
jgi:uncharacterized lipoprotein YajG